MNICYGCNFYYEGFCHGDGYGKKVCEIKEIEEKKNEARKLIEKIENKGW